MAGIPNYEKQKLSSTDESNFLPTTFSLEGYPSGIFIVIDGELRHLVDDSPPNTIPLSNNSGILNLAKGVK